MLAGLSIDERNKFSPLIEAHGLENALSRLRAMSGLLKVGQILDGLTKDDADKLDRSVCLQIVKGVDVGGADLLPVRRFAAWVKRAQYESAVEVFTTNYDLLLETAFDTESVLYFDGFSGVLRAPFRIELVDPGQVQVREEIPSLFTRLWKLHGSVNWAWDGVNVRRLGAAAEHKDVAAIYPSQAKYDQSRRYPFVVLQDRFRRALNVPETITVISGYAFGDQHLNEIIFDAAARRERSEIIVFSYDPIQDDLAQRASITPNLQVIHSSEAIIGGVRAPWAKTEAECAYWKADKLVIADFAQLGDFLARVHAGSSAQDPSLTELLGGGVEQ
ncbi:SIR2 family protein [Pseudoxanthomonas kaohsiungensis]|uniref:SIR2 family protein n=1 Tax=Pseudoxanthomonas kaohsiungensis TaxID=283923 RepID=A0ABW3LWQ4_9GAMM|nr:SIR2 family protein [Pseudoxanthomonas kaohsiungensis]